MFFDQAPAKSALERPHVLFIAIDDLRPAMDCYGDPLEKSPNINPFKAYALDAAAVEHASTSAEVVVYGRPPAGISFAEYVSSGSQRKDFVVEQTVSLPNGKHLRPVETVELVADTETVIQITNSNTVGFVVLDALQLLYVSKDHAPIVAPESVLKGKDEIEMMQGLIVAAVQTDSTRAMTYRMP